MTAVTVTAPTTGLALLADLDPRTSRPDRIHAVLGWTDHGERHYRPLRVPIAAGSCRALMSASEPESPATQLRLDLGSAERVPPTSSGRTWRTWCLPTIPPALRHLQLAALVRELATQLGD